MSANLKGLQGFKGLLLKHCEKVGVVVVAACALVFIVKSMGLERLPADKQPDRLTSLVNKTTERVETFKWDTAPEEEKLVAVSFTERAAHTVDPGDFQTSEEGFNPPVVPPTVQRRDPVLLAPQDLEVNVGAGLLAFVDEDVRRQRDREEAREEERRAKDLEDQRGGREDVSGGRERGGRRGGDRGGRGDRGYDRFGGRDAVDPEHPDRRRVSARLGTLAGAEIQGDERVERKHWAVVVAKVPIEDQIKLFHDALKDAKKYQPGFDCPEYGGYFVQRAEVVPDQEPQWQTLFIGRTATLVQETKDWAPSQPEVVDPRHLHSILTYPLPPLVGRDWKYDATHSEIPLEVDVVEEPDEVEEVEEETPAADEQNPDFFKDDDMRPGGRDRFSRGARGGREDYGRDGRGPGRGRGDYGRGYESRDYGRGESYGRGEGYGRRGDYGRGGGGRRGGGRMGTGAVDAICIADVPHLLFRFYDFNVDEGRRYVYRVRLVLRDVNQGMSYSALDQSVIDRMEARKADGKKPSEFRLTAWSEPSPVAQIPRSGGSVRTVSARPGSTTSEPEVTLLVQAFGVDESGKPIQTAKEKDLRRGSIANMTEEAEVLGGGGEYIDKMKDFKFYTDIAVLDIQGGDRLGGKLTEPARVLLMDSAGQLYIRDELEDFDDVDEHNAIFAKDETGGRGGRDDFRGRGDYGRGGGRGFEDFR